MHGHRLLLCFVRVFYMPCYIPFFCTLIKHPHLPIAQTKIDWKVGMTGAEMKQTVPVNTDVIFKWSGWHNVWKFPDKAAFDACDFSRATELAASSKGPYTYQASSAGIVYFGCRVQWFSLSNCKAKQKLALSVTGNVLRFGIFVIFVVGVSVLCRSVHI